ncbi:MAG: ribonuclease R [Patescibacteria group bacterium]|nr:ribonuclease R [Patescibacteria group bacterium]MDE2438636.1 ribonuclease R [Patescibacteria group bacterium]
MDNKTRAAVTGIISITSKGVGYVTVVDLPDDIQIEPSSLNTALHGDEVEVFVFPALEQEKPTGEVTRIVKREKVQFVGTVDKREGGAVAFVLPDDKRMYSDIFLPPKESRKVKGGYKVLVEIIKWDDPKKNPEGRVEKLIGKKGENNVEMESIVLEKGFAVGFPKPVTREADTIGRHATPISQKENTRRRDFRNATTFTIDPEDAKDFDDALSFKRKADGMIEVGIHIADVSYYVRPGTALDKEAQRRGVSIYLVDRTIPMLPEVLSNGVCSLNPNEDKLTFSAVITLAEDGTVHEVWMGRTIINSNKRFVYEEAQRVLDAGAGPYYEELHALNSLAHIFTKQRSAMGALDFEREEVKFKLDANGVPIAVTQKPRLDIHRLVEEFMVLANKEVASYLSNEIRRIRKGASLYRVHDVPKKESMNELLFLLRSLGHTIEAEGGHVSSKELNALFERIKGTSEEALIKTVALRSMAKAVYSTRNIGHYGLALENYTHFTSPIRRYADLIVHRTLQKHLDGGHLTDEEVGWLHSFAVALSAREMDAVDAERTSIAYKQVEYMKERVGNSYEGIISGIANWGVYVEEKETMASGMVKLKDMSDDFYVFEKGKYSLVGTHTHKRYAVGDCVKIKVVGADLEKRTLDFVFV